MIGIHTEKKNTLYSFVRHLLKKKWNVVAAISGNSDKRPRLEIRRPNKHFNIACEDSDDDGDACDIENDITQDIEREVNFYFNQRVDTNDTEEEKFCPLKFFKENQLLLPHLCEEVKSLFWIPVSSVPSEQPFSHVKEIITEKRNRHRPELAETLTLIAENSHLA